MRELLSTLLLLVGSFGNTDQTSLTNNHVPSSQPAVHKGCAYV